MRRDWDARATERGRMSVGSEPSLGGLYGLAALYDTQSVLGDVYPELGDRTRVLEIGCGIGRLMRFLALIFDEVEGIDVSKEMIARSKEYLGSFPNARTHLGDGCHLKPFADASIGFAFSYAVFPHISSKEVIRTYVHEARRVLEPGGLFKFYAKYRGPERGDTWDGANVSVDDVERWCAETGFEQVNAYSVDERVGCVILRGR